MDERIIHYRDAARDESYGRNRGEKNANLCVYHVLVTPQLIYALFKNYYWRLNTQHGRQRKKNKGYSKIAMSATPMRAKEISDKSDF
jgi:hypothetical protein